MKENDIRWEYNSHELFAAITGELKLEWALAGGLLADNLVCVRRRNHNHWRDNVAVIPSDTIYRAAYKAARDKIEEYGIARILHNFLYDHTHVSDRKKVNKISTAPKLSYYTKGILMFYGYAPRQNVMYTDNGLKLTDKDRNFMHRLKAMHPVLAQYCDAKIIDTKDKRTVSRILMDGKELVRTWTRNDIWRINANMCVSNKPALIYNLLYAFRNVYAIEDTLSSRYKIAKLILEENAAPYYNSQRIMKVLTSK